MKSQRVKVATLVLDYDLYPRGSVDTHLGTEYARALEAGAVFPPIIVCEQTHKVIDGFKRCRAHLLHYGEDAEIAAVFKHYKNDGERVKEAMYSAATQGERLTTSDMVRCAFLGEKYKLPLKQLASALQMKPERFLEIVKSRSARSKETGEPVALKAGVADLWAGRKLTPAQEEENRKLIGMRPLYFVNRLIGLLENDGIDIQNEKLMEGLERLAKLIERFIKA